METNAVARLHALSTALRNARRSYNQLLAASKAGVENTEERHAARQALRAIYHERDVLLGLREEEDTARVEGHMVDVLPVAVMAEVANVVPALNALAA